MDGKHYEDRDSILFTAVSPVPGTELGIEQASSTAGDDQVNG